MRLSLRPRRAVITREGLGAVHDALSATEGRTLDDLAAATGLTMAQLVTHVGLLIASDLAEGTVEAETFDDHGNVVDPARVTYVRTG